MIKPKSDSDYRNSEHYARVMRDCIDSLQYFMELCFPHAFTLPSADHHADFEEMAMDFDLKHAVVEVFRESAKSTYFGVGLPLWHRFCEPFKKAGFYPKNFAETQAFLRKSGPTFVVIRSKSGTEARRRLKGIKTPLGAAPTQKKDAIEGKRNFEVHFGTFFSVTTNTQYELHLSDGSLWISLGSGQQGHGLQEDFVRPSLIINDDPETEENTKTEASTDANYTSFMNGVYAGLRPEGRCYTLATPINTHCQVRRLKKLAAAGMPGWKYFHYAFLLYDDDGKPYSAWPEKKSVRTLLEEKRAMEADGTVYLWFLKYQCQIRARETQLFREEDIMLYDGTYSRDESGNWYLVMTHAGPYTEMINGSPYPLDQPEIIPVNLFTGHDPSHGVGGDDACKLTRAFGGKRHFIKHILSRNDTDTYGQCLWILEGSEEDHVPGYREQGEMAIVVEGTFFEKAMQRTMNDTQQESGIYAPVQAISPGTAKDKRYVNEIVRDFKLRQVYFRKEHEKVLQHFFSFNALQKDQKDDEIDAYWLSRKTNWPPSHTADMLSQREKRPARRVKNDWQILVPSDAKHYA